MNGTVFVVRFDGEKKFQNFRLGVKQLYPFTKKSLGFRPPPNPIPPFHRIARAKCIARFYSGVFLLFLPLSATSEPTFMQPRPRSLKPFGYSLFGPRKGIKPLSKKPKSLCHGRASDVG